MNAIGLILSAGIIASPSAPAHAERCMAGSRDANGASRYTPVVFDLDSAGRLDSGALPERTSAVMCARRSIVPRPNDIRVLSEWNVGFGIIEEGGRGRVLWISVDAGRVETRVERGELTAAERAAIEAWRTPANIRFLVERAPR